MQWLRSRRHRGAESLHGQPNHTVPLWRTSAKPEEVKKIFKRTVDTGIQHGTVTVLLENGIRSALILERDEASARMAFFVFSSIENPSWAPNRTARIIRRASSRKRSFASPTQRIRPLSKSPAPSKRSIKPSFSKCCALPCCFTMWQNLCALQEMRRESIISTAIPGWEVK